jgi:hypothetical protein
MRVTAAVAALTLLAACAFAGAQVRKRAASDFGCAEEDVWVDEVGASYVASGCRKEAAYRVEDGRITRTSEIRQTAGTRPPLPIDRIPDTNSIGLD